jgi:hypothetical protein
VIVHEFYSIFCLDCQVCLEYGNIHVVVVVAMCWALWKLRNRVCFEKKLIDFYACSFLRYWDELLIRLKRIYNF